MPQKYVSNPNSKNVPRSRSVGKNLHISAIVSLPDFPLALPYCSNHPPIIPQAAQVAPPFLSAAAAVNTNGKSFIFLIGVNIYPLRRQFQNKNQNSRWRISHFVNLILRSRLCKWFVRYGISKYVIVSYHVKSILVKLMKTTVCSKYSLPVPVFVVLKIEHLRNRTCMEEFEMLDDKLRLNIIHN